MSYHSLEDTGDARIDKCSLEGSCDDSRGKMEGRANGNGDYDDVGEHEEEPLNPCLQSCYGSDATNGLQSIFLSINVEISIHNVARFEVLKGGTDLCSAGN